MYENFFALKKAPFSLVPDPECIYLTAQHADAISGLAFGVLERKGYAVLTAEAGLGKTMSLRALSQLLAESDVELSMIFAPTLTPSEFLEMAMLNFGFKDVPASKAQRLKLLEEFLVRSDAAGKVVALIVDEAHQLSPELLEEVRLLSNFESSSRKLLQIVLVGQNQLNERLNLPELWQLKQRIAIRLSLQRLDREGVEEYIRFRWTKAGGAEPSPFSNAAFDAIAHWSSGIPRLINVICDNALLIAFSETNDRIDLSVVREACEGLSLPTPTIARHSRSFAGARPIKTPPEQIPGKTGEQVPPAGPANGWASSQPSLVKRWLRLSGSQRHPPSGSGSSILSIDKR